MKKNNKTPKLRFSGYTDDWEQRKVGDFLTESRIRGNTGLDAKKLTVKLWGKGVVEKNDFGGSEHTQYFTRRKGQFIYSKLDFLNSAFGVIPEKLDNYESTADLPAFDLDGMNPYFMYFVAIQESFYLKHGSIADGSRKARLRSVKPKQKTKRTLLAILKRKKYILNTWIHLKSRCTENW